MCHVHLVLSCPLVLVGVRFGLKIDFRYYYIFYVYLCIVGLLGRYSNFMH